MKNLKMLEKSKAIMEGSRARDHTVSLGRSTARDHTVSLGRSTARHHTVSLGRSCSCYDEQSRMLGV